MRAINHKWPFRPIHITNDGEISQRNDLRKLTGVGIISNEHLQGIETAICTNIQNPTAIIEFSANGGTVRTDSPLVKLAEDPFGFRPACRIFQECTDGRYYLESDTVHAGMFYGLRRDDIATRIQTRIGECEYIRNYREDEALHFEFVEDKKRVYLEYDGPLLGYRELIFPIFFEDRVIATFFVIDICVRSKLKFVYEKQRDFFRRNPNCFDEYCQRHGCTKDEIEKAISDAHERWVNEPSHVLSKEQYERLIGEVFSELSGLERTLQEQMALQRERYVRQCISQRIKEFRRGVPGEGVPSKKKQELLWRNIGSRLEELLDDFAIKYVVVFGSESVTRERVASLDVVACAGRLPEALKESIRSRKVRFNLGKMPRALRKDWISSAEEGRISDAFEGWPGEFNKETNLIRVFQVPFFTEASLALVVGYYEWNSLEAVENRPGGELSVGLQAFYGVVLSSVSAALGAAAESRMEAALRIFGHEAGQLTAGLDWLRAKYLSDPEELRKLSVEKAGDLCRDIDGFMRQLNVLFAQANVLMEVPEPRRHNFLAHRELLLKWKDVFRLEAHQKRLRIDVLGPGPGEDKLGTVHGDIILLEQVLYNLMNNAIKYCHRGTVIRVEYTKEIDQARSPHVLTVTDYGIEMMEGDWAYQLYRRGQEVTVRTEEGLGIGLYIARAIARKHGGDISHSCRQISPYNVPLIGAYLSRDFAGKSKKIGKQIEGEMERITCAEKIEIDKIVAFDEGMKRIYDPEDLELTNNIETPTYEVSVSVVIPVR